MKESRRVNPGLLQGLAGIFRCPNIPSLLIDISEHQNNVTWNIRKILHREKAHLILDPRLELL